MAMFATSEKFLAKYLGGRYQESMTPAVATRLNEITVDVKTVTLPRKVDAAAGAPKPAMDLSAGSFKYKATIVAGAQTIPLTTTTEIKEDGGSWVATEIADTPFGKVIDVATIEKGTLALKHRSITQNSVVIELDFKGSKVTGTMTQSGQAKAIDVDLGGICFADGGDGFDVLARLPLAAGYSTTFRNFDLQKQKPLIKNLKVVGSESITVPGGTFDVFKVEVVDANDAADRQTIWIAKDSHKVVKISAVLVSFGGALLTSELVP
jgi:hypothetical protein